MLLAGKKYPKRESADIKLMKFQTKRSLESINQENPNGQSDDNQIKLF